MTWPLESVVRVPVEEVLPPTEVAIRAWVPLRLRVTDFPCKVVPEEFFSVTVTVDVVVPSAATLVGDAAIDDWVASGVVL